MFGALAQRGRDKLLAAQEAKRKALETSQAMERARRRAAQQAETRKRRVKDVLSEADRGALGSLFQLWDRDGSGFLDRAEFDVEVAKLCLKHDVPLTSEVCDDVWADFDLDGSGSVTYEEWLRISLRDQLAQGSTRVIDAFRSFDRSGEGLVDKSEFLSALRRMGYDAPQRLVEEVFESMDADGSGSLTMAELHKQIRQGSAVRLDRALQAGQVSVDTSRANRHTLRGSLATQSSFPSLVAQMARHIITAADSGRDSTRRACHDERRGRTGAPRASQPGSPSSVDVEPPSTSLWVCKALAEVGPRKPTTHTHTALNDDHTASAAANAQRWVNGRRGESVEGVHTTDREPRRKPPPLPQHLLDALSDWEGLRQRQRGLAPAQVSAGGSPPSLIAHQHACSQAAQAASCPPWHVDNAAEGSSGHATPDVPKIADHTTSPLPCTPTPQHRTAPLAALASDHTPSPPRTRRKLARPAPAATLTRPASAATLKRPASAAALKRPASAAALSRPASAAALSRVGLSPPTSFCSSVSPIHPGSSTQPWTQSTNRLVRRPATTSVAPLRRMLVLGANGD